MTDKVKVLVNTNLSSQCPCGEQIILKNFNKNRENNQLSNLQLVCRPCHLKLHNRIERQYTLWRKAV